MNDVKPDVRHEPFSNLIERVVEAVERLADKLAPTTPPPSPPPPVPTQEVIALFWRCLDVMKNDAGAYAAQVSLEVAAMIAKLQV